MSIRPLMELIKKAEAPLGYDQLNYYMEKRVGKHRLTAMGVKDVLDLQKFALAQGSPSTAAGQYQILLKTLLWLCVKLKLKAEQLFDAKLQDQLALTLMERRGLSEFKNGHLSMVDFANNLAMEWAGLPVVSAIEGWNNKMLPRGVSYYSGDKLNRAIVTPEEVLAALGQIRDGEDGDIAAPIEPQTGGWKMFWTFIMPILVGQLRHLLTAAGGALVANGWLSNDDASALTGALVTIVGAVWSALDKKIKSS